MCGNNFFNDTFGDEITEPTAVESSTKTDVSNETCTTDPNEGETMICSFGCGKTADVLRNCLSL